MTGSLIGGRGVDALAGLGCSDSSRLAPTAERLSFTCPACVLESDDGFCACCGRLLVPITNSPSQPFLPGELRGAEGDQ